MARPRYREILNRPGPQGSRRGTARISREYQW